MIGYTLTHTKYNMPMSGTVQEFFAACERLGIIRLENVKGDVFVRKSPHSWQFFYCKGGVNG